jgi:hypothetical protein
MCLGIGETLIPLGALRGRLGELPQEKAREIICYLAKLDRGWRQRLPGRGCLGVSL